MCKESQTHLNYTEKYIIDDKRSECQLTWKPERGNVMKSSKFIWVSSGTQRVMQACLVPLPSKFALTEDGWNQLGEALSTCLSSHLVLTPLNSGTYLVH